MGETGSDASTTRYASSGERQGRRRLHSGRVRASGAARHAAEVRRRRPRILAFGVVVAIVGLVVLLAVSPVWGAVVLLVDLALMM